jgi:hypothetical protein
MFIVRIIVTCEPARHREKRALSRSCVVLVLLTTFSNIETVYAVVARP